MREHFTYKLQQHSTKLLHTSLCVHALAETVSSGKDCSMLVRIIHSDLSYGSNFIHILGKWHTTDWNNIHALLHGIFHTCVHYFWINQALIFVCVLPFVCDNLLQHGFIYIYTHIYIYMYGFCFLLSPQPRPGQGPFIVQVSRSHTHTHTHTHIHTRWDYSERVLCASQGPLPTQHTTNTRDVHPCPQRDTNPRFQ
jgi:hypothetical protein